ncbi:hypothetical protein NKH18_50480 [Streptomyces sp. M10(2022)]
MDNRPTQDDGRAQDSHAQDDRPTQDRHTEDGVPVGQEGPRDVTGQESTPPRTVPDVLVPASLRS